MPIYEFLCKKCGNVLEVWQRASDPWPKRCAKCGGALRKLLSPPGIVFKGSGFYTTDYAQAEQRRKEKEQMGKAASGEKSPAAAEA